MTDSTEQELRTLLADIVGLDTATVDGLPAGTPLLTGPIGLSSRGGALLLVRVREQFGVDVAAEDLALESLETLGTLTDFIRTRRG